MYWYASLFCLCWDWSCLAGKCFSYKWSYRWSFFPPAKSSIEQPPSLEPESLPEDLNYSSKLECEQEEKLLQEYKKGIGWALATTRDIIPFMRMHRISLEDGTEIVSQPLNPLILDVVENEITFTWSFDTFTYQRSFFDPEIKGEGINKNFKVNGHCPKLLHESPTLEE